MIALCAVLSDADNVDDFAKWARVKEDGLRRFPALIRTPAVDGKTLRGSGKGTDSPVHRVSAFATDLGRVLGQEKVVGKSNEITAIPKWLEALTLKGLMIDAMGGQKAIAAQIVAQKGDYLLAVKGNLRTLHAAIQKTFANLSGEQS